MKHEPKTMKAKADLMLKRGSISEKQRDKLHAKADVEIGKAKRKSPPDALSAKGGDPDDGAADKPGADADASETKARRKAATEKPVLRGQPLDKEERDL